MGVHRLHLFARRAVLDLPGGASPYQFAVRAGFARHPRELRSHAGDRCAVSLPYPQGLYDVGGDRRHRRRPAGADHFDRFARRARFPALGRRSGDARTWRRRCAVWWVYRHHHLFGRARPVLRHQSAILVFLDRPPSGRGGDAPAERRSWGPWSDLPNGSGAPHMSAPALSTRMVNKRFGQLAVARDISISIPRGERYALIGPNGAGKTTLINLMTGTVRP